MASFHGFARFSHFVFGRVLSRSCRSDVVANMTKFKRCKHISSYNQLWIKNGRNKREKPHEQQTLCLAIVPCILSFSLFTSKPEQQEASKPNIENKNKDIIDLIKQGKASIMNKENSSKAEMFYLRALHLALERNDRSVIAYIQDLIANLALNTNQLDKAEPLFRNVLKNLIATGMSQTDPAVLEISLKLASIYAQRGQKDLAINGYEWSAEACRNNINEMEKKKIDHKEHRNSMALLGMILDSHGRYLHDIGHHKSALTKTLEALEISKSLFGEEDIRTLVLYNDISSIKTEMGHYSEALEYANKAINITVKSPNIADASEKAVFYANVSSIYMKQGKSKEAEEAFKLALIEVSKTNDDQLKAHIASMINNLPDNNENSKQK